MRPPVPTSPANLIGDSGSAMYCTLRLSDMITGSARSRRTRQNRPSALSRNTAPAANAVLEPLQSHHQGVAHLDRNLQQVRLAPFEQASPRGNADRAVTNTWSPTRAAVAAQSDQGSTKPCTTTVTLRRPLVNCRRHRRGDTDDARRARRKPSTKSAASTIRVQRQGGRAAPTPVSRHSFGKIEG